MLGYLNKPEETKSAIDDKGWLATGDVGYKDKHDYFWLTGRAKEIMKNPGGETIAPVPIEQKIEKACEGLVAKTIVVGDKEYYLSVLVMLPEEFRKTKPTGKLAGTAKGLVEG